MTGQISIDTREFAEALREYRLYTKRDLATMINTACFYIARGAVRNTARVPRGRIEDELAQTAVTKKGKTLEGVTLAQALVASKLVGQFGAVRPHVTSAQFKALVRQLKASRLRSRAFLASGFLPAVKAFEPLADRKAGAPGRDAAVKQFGRPKGFGTAARSDSFVARAIIENAANAKNDRKESLAQYAGPALQKAVRDEAASMQVYAERKFQESAHKFSAK